jgi:hypothetical protein
MTKRATFFFCSLAVFLVACGSPDLSCANSAAALVDTATPPRAVAKLAATQLDAENPFASSQFGRRTLRIRSSDGSGQKWMLPMQQKNGEYCAFVETNDSTRISHEIASFVGCRIKSVRFSDLNGDGTVDAVYSVKIKSPQTGAWVDEELLFTATKVGSNFCKSDQSPKFTADPHALRCP